MERVSIDAPEGSTVSVVVGVGDDDEDVIDPGIVPPEDIGLICVPDGPMIMISDMDEP